MLLCCRAKVTKFEYWPATATMRDQDVLHFQISERNTLAVNVIEAVDYLQHAVDYLELIQLALVLQ